MSTDTAAGSPRNSLEAFLCDALEDAGGLCDQVEPQVYDLIMPSAWTGAIGASGHRGDDVTRVVFDPEALPEHPGSQFITLGAPMLDALLTESQVRGRVAQAFVYGLNLEPHDLPRQIRRSLTLADGATLQLTSWRRVQVRLGVFWFLATIISDQKEQRMFPVAVDLHDGRQVRHLDKLLAPSRLEEEPLDALPEVSHLPLAHGYRLARERVVRSVASAANLVRRELHDRSGRQEARMKAYYQDMLTETDEQIARAQHRGDDPARLLNRRQTFEREMQLRLAELRRKNALRVSLRLMNLLIVCQPKLQIEARLAQPNIGSAEVELLWDPVDSTLDAPACPQCRRPSFALRLTRRSVSWLCTGCTGETDQAVSATRH